MVATSLISQSIFPLKTSDPGRAALELMNEYGVDHLPIVNNEQLLGLIYEDDILENDIDEPVGSYQLSLQKAYVRANDHIFDVMKIQGLFKLTTVPVVDDFDNYMGIILQKDLLNYFSNRFSFIQPGAIITLEMSKSEYSLSNIAQIAESENVVILNSFITSEETSEFIFLHLKTNTTLIFSLIAAFERHGYKINAHFQQSEESEIFQERYDSLMFYLNM